MKNNEITQRIYAKSDRELRAKLEASIKWVWDETRHGGAGPGEAGLAELNHELNGTGLPEFKDMPWIGAIQKQFVWIAFLYLRERYRNLAVTAFMEKVEAVESIINQQ